MTRHDHQRSNSGGRSVHDVGGLSMGAIDRDEHELSFYEKRVDALLMLLAAREEAFRVDALRRKVEELSERDYDKTPYYDRWIRAIRDLLVEQEVLTREEVEARISEVCDRLERSGLAVDRGRIP